MKVLAIGSHFDDIWLGCSGALILLSELYDAQIVCVDLCDNYPHLYFDRYDLKDKADAISALTAELCDVLGFRFDPIKTIKKGLQDRDFPVKQDILRNVALDLSKEYNDADLVFIPREDDYHRDHALTAAEIMKKFRSADIFQYEIKSFRRTPFQHNVFVDLSQKSNESVAFRGNHVFQARQGTFAEKKAAILETCFLDIMEQEVPNVFSRERTLGKMAFRASENSKTAQYAESFFSELII